jgi:hypothetical protein
MPKSHLYFRNPKDGVERLKLKRRFVPDTNKEETDEFDPKSYTPQKEEYRRAKSLFQSEQKARRSKRNPELKVPTHIEYVLIEFFDAFNSLDFENKYRKTFGLSPVLYFEYNTKGLFAIIDDEQFKTFISDIEVFINSEHPDDDESYHHMIRFIKKFYFLTTQRMIDFVELQNYVQLSLVDNVEIFEKYILPLEASLEDYLKQRDIKYIADYGSNILELYNIPENLLNEILDNFDIVHSVNSPLSGHVRPTPFNLPERSYGFVISNADDELPIIGIIDSGVSGDTPLSSIVINTNNDFDINRTSPLVDNIDHGTAVGAFAALGNRLIIDFQPNVEAQAKLLSIKIIDSRNAPISETEVIRLIRKAHIDFGVRIFVLTTGYVNEKKINSAVSQYGFLLDNLAYELDILIFISVGNIMSPSSIFQNNGLSNKIIPYPQHLVNPKTSLCVPADSYNNVSCGATAENFESFDNQINITPSREYPAYYSRRFYMDKNHSFFNRYRNNIHLTKPDILSAGGDYDEDISQSSTAGISCLCNNPSQAYLKSVGTSYAAPLLANLAARILKQYPELSTQSIKALIINSATSPNFGGLLNGINITPEVFAGNGSPDENHAIYSDDNFVSLILEDKIAPGEIKSFPINIPTYLLAVDRTNSLLEFNVTLCFSFAPVHNNQIAYCPLNISFGIFKNLPLSANDENGIPIGLNANSSNNIKFRQSWSQDYYWKIKLLSNCQKQTFTVSKKHLIQENNTFKLAIKCEVHKLLPDYVKNSYANEHEFSAVISVKEFPIKGKNTNQLYNEMIAVNNLEIITELEAEAELEN